MNLLVLRLKQVRGPCLELFQVSWLGIKIAPEFQRQCIEFGEELLVHGEDRGHQLIQGQILKTFVNGLDYLT